MAEQQSGRLKPTAANNSAIIAAIQKDRPVGEGHHASHQYNAIMSWLKKKEKRRG